MKSIKYYLKTISIFLLVIVTQSCGLVQRLHQEYDKNGNKDDYTVKWDDSNYNYDKELNQTDGSDNENLTNSTKKNSLNNNDAEFYKKYSNILGVQLNGTENKVLIQEISEWLGTKYVWAGETKQKGTDCSGMTKQIYLKVYNIELGRTAGAQFEACKAVSADNLREGDLVFFKINSSNISHVGLYIEDGYFVHATTSRGVMISNLSEAYYKKYFYKGGHIDK